jgi:iron complex outermembrane receptor protein
LFKPSDIKTIYFSASRGFSLPAIEETLTQNGTINSGIKPETGYNFEIGGKLFFMNRSLYAEASLYRMEITDLLVARRVGDDQYVGVNAGKTLHQGVELQINYTTSIWKNISMTAQTGISAGKYKFLEFVDEDNDYSGNDLTGVPASTVHGRLTFSYQKLFLSAEILSIDGFPINDANTVYTEKYALLNLKTGYKANVNKNLTAAISFGVNNATDTRYASMALVNSTAFGNASPRFYYPGTPVNYYGNISLSYAFNN